SNVLARPAPCRAGPSDPNTTAVTPPRPRRPNRAAAQAADRARTAAVAVARSRARPFRLLSRQTNRGPYANRPGLPKGSARSVVFELDELSLGTAAGRTHRSAGPAGRSPAAAADRSHRPAAGRSRSG